jgi:hypothetical protein
MSTTQQYKYGTDVVEIYKHNREELQDLIKQKEVQYFRHCESPAYPQLGVNIKWFSGKPTAQALNDLTAWLLQGYTVATALHRPLDFSVQLKKPQPIIDVELKQIAKQAEAEYTADRYARNAEETSRQISFTVAREMREAEAAAAKAAADKLAAIQGAALADLIDAYAKPAKPKARKIDEVAA